MRFFSAPSAVLGLAAVACLPSALAKPYPVHIEELRELHNATQLERRSCGAGTTACGYYGTLCCPPGTCYTDSNNQAQCGTTGGNSGQWQFSTKTWVETVGLVTYTSVTSYYVSAAAQPTATCGGTQSPCGSICCDSGYYCKSSSPPQCAAIGGGTSGGIYPSSPLTPSAPLRPTNSGVVIVTYTGTPTATVPFQTPIPTGATGGLQQTTQHHGLSGGAIAGIVIGVIFAILLLLLLCLFCCARALFDTILAIFGLGKKRRHTHEETYIEERRHSAGGSAAAGGGRWYGQSRPSRPASEKKSGVGRGLGMAAVLGGLALALGLKRRHDKKDDKSTVVSGSSYYYSDYTSEST